jgi:beta-N-acetylhexosaminidase
MIDQEGGRVQRMRSPHWREYLPPIVQADQAADPVHSFYLRARLIAAELRDVGIDANCGPTCDIASDETHPFLQNRCLGRDPGTVIANARATADGYLAGGVLPILKHMPGHGRTTVDSHLNLPTANATLDMARDWDFAPFAALSDVPLGMSAHIVFPEAGDLPATQNPTLINIIRDGIGFDGLLMTDDLSMEALSGTIGERAGASIKAGCDVALHCNGDPDDMIAVAAAAGQMTDAAQIRADRALTHRKTPENIDILALEADLAAQLG